MVSLTHTVDIVGWPIFSFNEVMLFRGVQIHTLSDKMIEFASLQSDWPLKFFPSERRFRIADGTSLMVRHHKSHKSNRKDSCSKSSFCIDSGGFLKGSIFMNWPCPLSL